MEDRALIALAVVGVLVFGWLLLAPPRCSEPPAQPDAAVVDAAPPPVDAAVVDAMLPDAFSVDDESLTVGKLRHIGTIGRPAQHLEALFEGRPNWTRDPRSPAPTWVNQNQVRLSFKVRGGRVASVGAEFPESSVSADLTALSEFMVGQHDALPIRLEVFSRDEPILTEGAFADAFGRTMYFRAEMRRDGEPPWGPSEFEIATTPWPGQPEGLTPPELLPGVLQPSDPSAPVPPPDFHDPEPVGNGEFDPSQAL